MFRKGEYVIYGNNGICCIEEIGVPRDTPLGDSGKEYYTLAPVFSSGKIYAPLDTHRCEDLVRLIKTVYRKEKRLEENGKKLAKTEREYSKLAKELLHREFSMALEVPYDEVENYITEKVAALQK